MGSRETISSPRMLPFGRLAAWIGLSWVLERRWSSYGSRSDEANCCRGHSSGT
jgi:hypothetical protein